MSNIYSALLGRPLARYTLAVVIVAVSFLLRSGITQSIGAELPPFIFLYPAVMIVAVLGGLRPGLLATILAILGTDYFVFAPVHHFSISKPSDVFALLAFAAMGILMSLLAERHQRSQRAIAAYQSERALRETEALYQNLFNSMEEGFCIIEVIFDAKNKPVDFRFLELNASYEKQTGIPNPLGKTMREVAPDLEQYWFELYGKVALTGEPAHYVNEAKPINGYYDVRAYRVGEPGQHRVAVVFNEISERMRTEKALRYQAELLELAHDTIMVRGLDGTIRFWNHGAEEMYGYTKQQAIGRISHEILATIFPQPLGEIEALLLQQGRWEGELVHTAQDGARIVVASRWVVQRDEAGQAIGALEINNDISERKRAEEHTQKINRVYRVLSDINQTIVREKDSRAMLEAACRIAVEKGKFRMAWIGMVDPATHVLEPVASGGKVDGYLDLVRIDLRDPNADAGPAARSFLTGKHATCDDIEHQLFRPWRSDALLKGYRSVAAFPLRCEGEIIGIFCLYASELAFFDDDEMQVLDEMAMDISYALEVNRHEEDRHKADEELRWRTAFFEAQLDSSTDGIFVVDVKGKRLYRNKRALELFGFPEHVAGDSDDLLQRNFVASVIKSPADALEKLDNMNSQPDEVSRDEVELIDGKILERCSSPVRDKAGNHYGRIWTLRDITERRQLEEQFRQAQKMEAIGQLTGGIAHDFNNLLTVILGCSEVIGEEAKENPRFSKMARMILDAAQKGAELTHRMLAFARRQALQPRPVDVNRLLVEMQSFLRRTLSADIELNVILGGVDCEALVDPTQLESAILNLCVNARDAMPGGGRLTIETDNTVLDADYGAENPDVTPGQYLLVAVSDTGCGISPENLNRVFDPFFTTKEVGKGTGLGLSMVYGFMKQTQGHIKIYTELGQGTSVKLYLPRTEGKKEQSSQIPSSFADLRGSEVVLLVEDDAPLREFARSELVNLGYRVLEAENGKNALKIIAERADIDLLFTDIIMPGGMNGRELGLEALRLNPKLKVLYTSGYAENAILHDGLFDNDVQFLGKPYTRRDLAMRIRGILTGS